MKSLWNNFKVAFAMFSKIPMPRADWTKENMKYMFCFFPFIGTGSGALTMLAAYAGLYFGFQAGFVITDKIYGLLGLCQRAGKCKSGEFAVEKSIKSGKSFLVIIPEDEIGRASCRERV